MKNSIEYSMTSTYRKEWGPVEAIREIVQNCLDNKDCKSDYLLSNNGDVEISTIGFMLPVSALALGESVKEDGAIGGFGEGFKLALMVLVRAGCSPVVYSGEKILRPSFQYNELIERETFVIDIEQAMEFYDGLKYVFSVDASLLDEIKDKVNLFSDNVLPLPNDVDVLEEHPGKVMVNGLFVCKESKFRFGYNFAPGNIELGCDRQIASSFGMAWETSKVWAEKINESNADLILNMMSENQLDVADIQYHISESKAKLITDAFVARFGNVTIKPMGSTLSHGMNVSGGLYSTMRKSGYTEVANPFEESGTPFNKIKELMASEKKHMRSRAYKALNELLAESKNWVRK